VFGKIEVGGIHCEPCGSRGRRLKCQGKEGRFSSVEFAEWTTRRGEREERSSPLTPTISFRDATRMAMVRRILWPAWRWSKEPGEEMKRQSELEEKGETMGLMLQSEWAEGEGTDPREQRQGRWEVEATLESSCRGRLGTRMSREAKASTEE